MKKILVASILGIAASTVSVAPSYGQGDFYFSNYGGNSSPVAPVYGPEAGNPSQQKWGNAAEASPPGTQTYSGSKLDGMNYSVEAWYSLTLVSDVFALNAGASPVPGSMTTFFSGPGAGYFIKGTQFIPNVLFTNGNSGVFLQVRVWDNGGGQLNSWTDARDAALAGSGKPVGWSKVFWQDTDLAPGTPPGMVNFESFNAFIVPEPSTVGLVALGGLALLLFRRHSRG